MLVLRTAHSALPQSRFAENRHTVSIFGRSVESLPLYQNTTARKGRLYFGAIDGIRTHKLSPTDFKSVVYANSTTIAWILFYTQIRVCQPSKRKDRADHAAYKNKEQRMDLRSLFPEREKREHAVDAEL